MLWDSSVRRADMQRQLLCKITQQSKGNNRIQLNQYTPRNHRCPQTLQALLKASRMQTSLTLKCCHAAMHSGIAMNDTCDCALGQKQSVCSFMTLVATQVQFHANVFRNVSMQCITFIMHISFLMG